MRTRHGTTSQPLFSFYTSYDRLARATCMQHWQQAQSPDQNLPGHHLPSLLRKQAGRLPNRGPHAEDSGPQTLSDQKRQFPGHLSGKPVAHDDTSRANTLQFWAKIGTIYIILERRGVGAAFTGATGLFWRDCPSNRKGYVKFKIIRKFITM
jgi:hypothetical protein